MSKLVLIALADRADDFGRCHPSIATIAKDCECGTTVVKRCLNDLEKKGFIERRNRAEEGLKTSNEYRIVMHGRDASNDSRQTSNDGREASRGRSRGVHKTPNETPIGIYTREEAFEAFWQAYPRKTSKQQGEKAFHKAVKDEQTLAEILANVQARLDAGEWDRARVQYIPHASTYLNQRRWTDEVITHENPNSSARPSENPRRLSPGERVRQRRAEAAERQARATN